MKMKKEETSRGFSIMKFKDRYDNGYSIQKSSLATEDAIWFGIDDPDPVVMAKDTPEGGTGWVPFHIPDNVSLTTRMHLTKDQVKELLPVLKKFVRTGEI